MIWKSKSTSRSIRKRVYLVPACNPALNWLQAVAIELESQNRLPVKLRACHLYDLCQEGQIPIPGLREESEKAGMVFIGNLMKKCFSDQSEITLDHFKICRHLKTERDENYRDIVIKTYEFTNRQ